jgi:CheY-like chemotaxis protein
MAEIKNNYPHIPIIAISADSNQENKTNSYKAGCDIFIEKPLDIPKFKTAICDFLNVNV